MSMAMMLSPGFSRSAYAVRALVGMIRTSWIVRDF
jgi:uncharacterized protein (DUF2235 family)